MKTDGVLYPFLQFPRLQLRESLIVLTIWLTYLVPISVEGLVVAHALLLLIIATCAADVAHRPSLHAGLAFLLFFLILSLSMATALYFGPQARFMPETVKLVLLFLGTFFIGLSVPAERLRALLAPAPWLCLIMVLGVFTFIGSPVAADGRLQIEGFLSPNVLGYLLVMNMAIVWSRPVWKIWDWLVFALLGLCMLACLSRGALIAAAAVFAVHFGLGRSALLFGGIAIALAIIFADNPIIERMLIVEDAISTGGSGRAQVWGTALRNWLDNPVAWLSGFGPASIHMHITILTTQDAAHSMYIGSLHYLGLLGLMYLLAMLAAGIIGVRRAAPSPERTLARDFLIIIMVNGLVDETYNASQVTAISAICFAVIVAVVLRAQSSTRPARVGLAPLYP